MALTCAVVTVLRKMHTGGPGEHRGDRVEEGGMGCIVEVGFIDVVVEDEYWFEYCTIRDERFDRDWGAIPELLTAPPLPVLEVQGGYAMMRDRSSWNCGRGRALVKKSAMFCADGQ